MIKIVPTTDLLPGGEASTSAEAADVARALTEDIIFGRLAPGERLIEDNLIGRFGVTRHLVRQALQELVRTSVAVREKNKSVKVRSLTPREVRQIYEVREMLQRHAALLIDLPAPASLIERLEHIHAEYGEHLNAGNYSGVHAANDAFHLNLFGACDNDYLVDSIRHYMWLTLPVRANKTADVDHARASQRDHYVMIQLLKGADRWALAQLCVDHLQGPKRNYLRSVEPDPAISAISSDR